MKLYLSSYKIGDHKNVLADMMEETGKPMGYIPNARDFTTADPLRRKEVTERDLRELADAGIDAEVLDLRKYFGKGNALKIKLSTLGGVWVSGGNTFVLRQAMMLSGFDELLKSLLKENFVYGGYSAAGCVLSPTLKCYQIVDDPHDYPYEQCKETLWEGLGLIDVAFMPHFDSDHSESADINKEIAYCEQHGIPYKTLRDGEVWIVEQLL